MNLLKNKKGANWTVIFTIITSLVVVVLILNVLGIIPKAAKDISSVNDCASIAGIEGRCVSESYACSEKIKGLACKGAKPVCCFDKKVYTYDEAMSRFRGELFGFLNSCKDDVSACDDATDVMKEIFLFTTKSDEGYVFIQIVSPVSGPTEFKIMERKNFFTAPRGDPKAEASFQYTGDTCLLKSGRKDGDVDQKLKGKAFTYCLGKEKEGILIGDCSSWANPKIKGNFISMRHLKENDATTPLCLFYG